MLRPATPLSVLFFAAFVLLLLSTLTTPIIQAIPLATYQGVNFGVFGYCQGDSCSGIRIGYSTGTPIPSYHIRPPSYRSDEPHGRSSASVQEHFMHC